MKCSACGGPLLSILERTRGLCASCHLFASTTGKQHVIERLGARLAPSPPRDNSNRSTGTTEDTAAPPAPHDIDADGAKGAGDSLEGTGLGE
jgi:hypothetical protein